MGASVSTEKRLTHQLLLCNVLFVALALTEQQLRKELRNCFRIDVNIDLVALHLLSKMLSTVAQVTSTTFVIFCCVDF